MKGNSRDNLVKFISWCEKFRKKYKMTNKELMDQVAAYLGAGAVVNGLTLEEFENWISMSCVGTYKLGIKVPAKKWKND